MEDTSVRYVGAATGWHEVTGGNVRKTMDQGFSEKKTDNMRLRNPLQFDLE